MTVLELLDRCDTVTAMQVASELGVSRQYARRLLVKAVDDGDAVRVETRPGLTATYRRVDHEQAAGTAATLPVPPDLTPGVEGIRGALRRISETAEVLERRIRSAGAATDRDVAACEWLAASALQVVDSARDLAAPAAIAA